MSTEGLYCWDGYPIEHGCICGNDCPPPSVSLPVVFSEQRWEGVTSRAFTFIRRDWAVERLEQLARTGNPTPVSGDDL